MTKNINLQGTWNFQLDGERVGIGQQYFQKKFEDTISLPCTTSMAQKGIPSDKRETGTLTDPYLFEGYAWYSREVELSGEDLGQNLFLYLERTRVTRVWVDDTLVGSYNSLNTPHIYDITPFVTKTSFRLTILVANVHREEQETDTASVALGEEDAAMVYPTRGGHLTSPDTQTNWNGILGEISLHVCGQVALVRAKTIPNRLDKSVTLELTTLNTTGENVSSQISLEAGLRDIHGLTGRMVPAAEYPVEIPTGESVLSLTYPLGEDGVCWSEYSPVIYQLTAQMKNSGEQLVTTFGLRDFTAGEEGFFINDRPTFLRGKHDGLIFPLTGAVPTTLEEWIRVMEISKSYGINHYRFHTCCPPEAAFVAADLLGIYMEPQLPFWGTLTAPGDEGHNEQEQSYLIQEGYRMMEFFGNHASYCMMSLGNELWGSKEQMSRILADYKEADGRHLYTQGSNNFQHTPVILPQEDFFVGVRLGKHRLFRGSYGMCDAPLGHIQTAEPSTRKNYDQAIHPSQITKEQGMGDEEIEIQYGTGVKKVKAAEAGEALIPKIPVVSHEIGQFCVFPNFQEIDKYTGVLKARNFEIFRERLEEKGMADQAQEFFYNSGKLAVQCYKEELEAAARTSSLAGYQILDVQDFSGQGTALVGILDAFMDSKGLVTTEEWAGYCSDAILMAEFDSYVIQAGETFQADIAFRYYRPQSLKGSQICYRFAFEDGTIVAKGELPLDTDVLGLQHIGEISIDLPQISTPVMCILSLCIEDTNIENQYELYLYPTIEDVPDLGQVITLEQQGNQVAVTSDFHQAESLLNQGRKVLYLPGEVAESLKGFYCTEFWCYPMFRDICEWMKKPVAVGTMGLLIQKDHPALKGFPSHTYATPQWYQLVSHCSCAILDETTDASYRPIVQMMDNFERNHKLGILFEGKVGEGSLMVCTIRLSELLGMKQAPVDQTIVAAGEQMTYRDVTNLPEVKQFIKSLVDYVTSPEFAPRETLDMSRLRTTFLS